MSSRVGLIVLGLVVAFTLSELFGVPQRIAIVIGLIPLALSKAFLSPYGSRASDILHDSRDPDQRG